MASRFPHLNTNYWCNSPDCHAKVLDILQNRLAHCSTEEIEARISKLVAKLDRDYTIIEYDFYAGDDNGEPCFDKPATANLLIILHEKYKAFKGATTEDIRTCLQLLCLAESRKGNFVLAADAYRLATEYKKQQSKGGRAKGERKTSRAVINLIVEILKIRPVTNDKVWKQIPSEPQVVEVKGCEGFFVFRAKDEDGTELLRIQPLTHKNDIRDDSKSRTCSRNAFDKRVTTARAELRE